MQIKLIFNFFTFVAVFAIHRSSLPEVFYKKDFLEISQNSQENTCAKVFFFNEDAG